MEARLVFGERPRASALLRRVRAVERAAREAGRLIEGHARLRVLRDAADGRFGSRVSVDAPAGHGTRTARGASRTRLFKSGQS
jgi:hypothetical protein